MKNKVPKYLQTAMYILENNCSRKEVRKCLGLASNVLNSNLIMLRSYDSKMYENVITILEENSYRDLKCYEFAKYIIDNNPTIKDVCEKFNYNHSTIYRQLGKLKDSNNKLYKEVIEILDKRDDSLPKCVILANYIIENDSSSIQVKCEFKMKDSALRSQITRLKNVNKELYKEVIETLKKNDSIIERKEKDGIPNYIQHAMYITENRATIEEAVNYFGTNSSLINVSVYLMLKSYHPSWYNLVMKIFKERADEKLRKEEVVGNFLIENCYDIEKACQHFNLKRKTINGYVHNLKNTNPEIYNLIKENIDYTKNKKYTLIAEYILNNNTSIEDICVKFNMERVNVYSTLKGIQKRHPKLYNQISSKLRAN